MELLSAVILAAQVFAPESASSSQAAGAPTVVNLVNLGRSPGVHATVDGHDALLEIDTGSFELRLDPSFVDKNGINRDNVGLRVGGGPLITLKPLVESIQGDDPGPVGAAMPAHEDGIIGLDVLRHYAIGIDTEGGKIAFWPGGNVTGAAANTWLGMDSTSDVSAKIDLHTDGEDDWYRVDTKVNERALNLVLDTGTAYSTVNPSLEKPLKLKIVGSTPVQEIGKFETLKVAMADSIEFGPLQADFPVLNIESSDDDHVDGILGTDALGSGKFLIDMPGLEMYARKVKQVRGNPLERRMRAVGLDLFPSEGQMLCTVVRPGSIAEKKGVQSGDPLVSIGDLSVEEMFSGLNEKANSDHLKKMIGVALKAMNGDLSVKVRRKDGSVIEISLPH